MTNPNPPSANPTPKLSTLADLDAAIDEAHRMAGWWQGRFDTLVQLRVSLATSQTPAAPGVDGQTTGETHPAPVPSDGSA